MISPVEDADLQTIRGLIAKAVRTSVARSDDEAEFLIADIEQSLSWWIQNRESGLHLKYELGEVPVGVVLVKNFWNLTNLFVDPSFQRSGVGRTLLQEAIRICRARAEREQLRVNSSANAVDFYRGQGFVKIGAAKDRPDAERPASGILACARRRSARSFADTIEGIDDEAANGRHCADAVASARIRCADPSYH